MPYREMLHRDEAEAIIARAADAIGTTIEEMLGPRRFAHLVLGRRVAIWGIRTRFSLSFPAIGRLIGIHHTTVMHNFYAFVEQVADDPELAEWANGVVAA